MPGIACMRYWISDTAECGDLTRGPRVIDEHVCETMRELLAEIQRGELARADTRGPGGSLGLDSARRLG
jgi:ketol-acid reductoisomerase